MISIEECSRSAAEALGENAGARAERYPVESGGVPRRSARSSDSVLRRSLPITQHIGLQAWRNTLVRLKLMRAFRFMGALFATAPISTKIAKYWMTRLARSVRYFVALLTERPGYRTPPMLA